MIRILNRHKIDEVSELNALNISSIHGAFRGRLQYAMKIYLSVLLLLSSFGLSQLQAEDKAIMCFETGWSDFGNSRALERFKEAKCHFNYPNIIHWGWVSGQDIDYTQKVEPELLLKDNFRLNYLYQNHIQIIARLMAVFANPFSFQISPSMRTANLTFDQWRELWLENYAKPLVQSCYENGIYIIDLTQEVCWYDHSWLGPRGPFRDDDTWHPFTTLNSAIYDPNLTVGEFKPKFHDTMQRLYTWKNANFPKVIFGSSMSVITTVEDAAKLTMYLKDCIDWMGTDVAGYINSPTDPAYPCGTWEDHYLHTFVPVIEDPASVSWATAIFESYGWKNGPEDYYGPPGTPYANRKCYSFGPFQDAMNRVVAYDGGNKYLKLLVYSSWVAKFSECYTHNNPNTPLSYANDLGTLPPWDPAQLPFPNSATLAPIYNRWGDTMPHPSDDPACSSFAYIRDVMHADSNPYWDNCPRYPLVVTREGIATEPATGKIYIRLRNLCASNAISANVHVYQTPPEITPWNRSTYKKASPENISNSLQSAYEIAFIPAGSFSVPGNGHLDTENNVIELEVSSALPLENGKNIHVYIEDSDTVKGWTACNDIPTCNDLAIDGSGAYKFDFYPPGTSLGSIYLRARARDIFGNYSCYTDALQVEKLYKLNLTCNAFDNDGINEMEYQYSADGTTWYDVPWQNYYCLTANDKEFKQNSRFTPGSTDMGHYPVIESINGTPLKGVAPLSVNFNVVASDPVGAITSIEWDFNRDGIIDATGANVSRIFTAVGMYNSLVKVANSEGYSSFAEIKVEVLDGSPLATITATPRSGSAPLTVQFQGDGTDYDGTIVAYAWDFTNDGVIDSTARNPSFTYTQVGNYTARLNVADNSNLSGSATVGIKVVNPNSIAACTILASTTEGEAPLTVNFSADISGGGVVSAYAWDFNNDGVIDSTEAAPACVYNVSGLYTVNLIVTDINGHSVTDYEYIIVKAGGLPAVDFTFSPERGIAPLAVNFQAFASDPGGAIVSCLWDFGDSTYSSQATPPPHVYALNNQYLVRLTVTDNDGNEVAVRKTVCVESGLGKLYGDGNEYKDIAVNQNGLTGGYYTYAVAPDVFGEECGRTGGTPIYFRGQDGNTGGNTNGLANAHGDLTDGNFGYARDEGVMWSGGVDPEITFDLQGKYALNNIVIWQDPIYDFESVTCYLSQDGVAWSQIGTFGSDGLNKVHLDLRNHSARKVKLAFNNTDGSNAYLAEIQIWGTPFEESLMDWVDDFEYADSPLNHGWQVSCGIGTVSTVYDNFLKSNVMKVSSPDGWNFGVIRRPTDDPQKSYAGLNKRYFSYTIKSEGTVWVYVLVHGDDNQWYYLVYRPSEANNYVGGPFVYYSLPIVYEGNQNWNTISRDLEKDLFTATGHHLKDVGLVFIRGGNYQLDDLSFSSSAPPTLNWGLFKDSVLSANGSMLKAMDYELGREVIKVHSSDPCLFAIKSQKEAGTNKKYAHFNFKTTSDMSYYILVKGSDDAYYYVCYLSGTGSYYTNSNYVYHYLGTDVKSGQWVDVYRNLDSDLYAGFGVHLKEITWILTRGGNYCLNLAEFSDIHWNNDVGCWKLDEGVGTTASDSSGSGNDGALQGNPQWTSGRINGALSFNGSNYVDCGSDSSLKVSAITMEAWVYSPTTNFSGPNEIAGAEGAFGYNITDNKIWIHINTVNQGWHWCVLSDALTWDGWHHVAFTYDGVNTVKCYRDGVLILTDTTSSSGILQWAAWTTKLYIGQINTGSRMFHGKIDEVKIYNCPLTAEEIRNYWQDVGYWKLDEGVGTAASDSSGSGNAGTLQGNPQWTSGRINGALSFNGSNYVDCGSNSSLKVSAITMEAWVCSPTTNFSGWNEIAGAEGAYGYNIADNKIWIHINTVNQGWHWCQPSDALTWDGWHHVAFTYDGVNTVRCYRDGALILTDTTSSSGQLQWAAWTTKLYIGQINTGSRLFKGMIDEVKISGYPFH